MYRKPHHRFIHGLLHSRADAWYGSFQALDRIDLRVRRGETVGIVGRNGSGKSTLLQVICGVLEPTGGRVVVDGRIAALLELGAGFDPDFTGRENVYLNGAVLGLTRAELDARFDDIIAFADIGDFIDQPVATYSSGMYVRLAFAVAINTDPRILVVDEALSVGDEAFQRKCFARIEALKRRGCTILFVSHAAGSIVELCDRAVLLDGGELIYSGKPRDTVALYQKLLYAAPERRAELRRGIRALHPGEAPSPGLEERDERPAAAIAATECGDAEGFDPALRSQSLVEYESRGARILDPHLVNERGDRVNVLAPGRPYRYRYRVAFDADARYVHLGMMIKSVTGVELFGMTTHATGDGIAFVGAGDEVSVEFRFDSHLLPGTYFMNAGVNGHARDVEGSFLHRILDVLAFRVERSATNRMKAGFYDLAREPSSSFRILVRGGERADVA
jgi:lipopolysaccharide transport system ATP-binding protein